MRETGLPAKGPVPVTISRRIALPLFASFAVLALAACKGEDARQQAAASAAPDAKPGIAIKDARVVLPGVAGNPGVAYFSLDNQTNADVAIAAVAIEGVGRSEMHSAKMGVLQGGKASAKTHLDFVPGGAHIMLFDVSSALKAGDETELTVIFADGDKISVKAKVQAAGDAAMGAMGEGHDH